MPAPGYRSAADPNNPNRMWFQPPEMVPGKDGEPEPPPLDHDQLWCPHGGSVGYYDKDKDVYHFFTLGDVKLEDGKLATFVPQTLQPACSGTVELHYSAPANEATYCS